MLLGVRVNVGYSVDTSARVTDYTYARVGIANCLVVLLDRTSVIKVGQTHDNKRESLLLLGVVLKCSCWNGNIGSANSDT